jgi:hypothetical protein
MAVHTLSTDVRLPCGEVQSSSHSIHRTAGCNNHVINFHRNKHLGLADATHNEGLSRQKRRSFWPCHAHYLWDILPLPYWIYARETPIIRIIIIIIMFEGNFNYNRLPTILTQLMRNWKRIWIVYTI